MPKSKSSTRSDRTKRNHRDPSQEREAQSQSDGVVEEELDELDTDKYEPPPRKEH
jgi:hypothetical protein